MLRIQAARAEARFARYGNVPPEPAIALDAAKDIPVDLVPAFSFKDEVR
jgi:hypothetical protein